jgi:hypothetical protein
MTFAFRGHSRRIARAVVDAMVPRWPDFEHDITDEVLSRVERLIEGQPAAVQSICVAGLWFFEVASFAFDPRFASIRPLTAVDRETCERRLTGISHHPVAAIRKTILLYQTFVNLCAYDLPIVEAYLGAERRAWRKDRARLRESLVQLDEGRALPPVPLPLADPKHLSPAEYLTPGVEPKRINASPARRGPRLEAAESEARPQAQAAESTAKARPQRKRSQAK